MQRFVGVLAFPERLEIIRHLLGGSWNFGELAKVLSLQPANLSYHLTMLRNAGLIQNKRSGRIIHYFLAPGILKCDETGGNVPVMQFGCYQLAMKLWAATPSGIPSESNAEHL